MTKQASIQELFTQSAERFGALVAIERGARRVSYAELEERSNDLTNFLLSAGIRKGAIVAILASDTVNIVTAILGILKAGCVFAPLDPKMPLQRLAVMVEQMAPPWFAVEAEFIDIAASLARERAPGVRVVCLEGAPSARAAPGSFVYEKDFETYHNPTKPPTLSEPDDMCSIFFTSGSTGRPKGIAGRLKGIAHFARWEAEVLGLGEGARVSQLTSPSFDGFLKDTFVPLCVGGTICAPESRDIVPDAPALAAWIDEVRLNVLHCVPSVFRSLINAGLDEGRFAALKYVVLAGEPLPPADVERWMEVYGERIRLLNLYGPTETTVTKLFHFVTAADLEHRTIPIGKPMPGARALVLNDGGEVCPPGTVGEIYIRTPYRSLGYYRQPELTAEVFIPNPFNDDPHDLIYKTGDYGRLLDDGSFEFHGRKDQQVKVRGVRVELGEIENLLRTHAAVADVAVTDREDSAGNKYLCAYYVLEQKVEPGDLKQHLLRALPAYMMPSAFVELDALPRTINGKLDRRALPAPGEHAAGGKETFVAPRTAVEEVLAGIWAEVLGVARVGVDDDFFALGGHSLLATQVVSRARAALGVEVTLRQLFERPTVRELGRELGHGAAGAAAAPMMERASREGALPLSFAQQRLWFMDQLEPGSAFYNVPAAVKLLGHLDREALHRALNEVVRRHEALRTTFVAVSGQPVQVIAPSLPLSLPVTDLRELPEQERAAVIAQLVKDYASQPFDLSRGPLLRVSLLRSGEEEHVVLFNMHHIISDVWSVGIFVNEMAKLYEAYVTDGTAALPALTMQYADYAVWQRDWLRGEVLETQLAYWREQLADAPSVLDFPKQRARHAAGRGFVGARLPVSFPDDLIDSLKTMSRREGATLFMLLLAAFAATLRYHARQDDILIGTPIVHRKQIEIENLIGFFINTLVLRARMSGDMTFRELLAATRETALGAYEHQDVPFERLVEELKPERSLSHNPLFQVSFTLDQIPIEAVELAGLTLLPLDFDPGKAQFDLVLHLSDAGGQIFGSWQYRTDLFDLATMQDFARHYESILRRIVAEPDVRLRQLEEALAAEDGELLAENAKEMAVFSQQKLRKVRRQTLNPLPLGRES